MRSNTNTAAALCTLLMPFFLTACGGGGGDSDTSEPVAQTAAHCFDDSRYALGNRIQQEFLNAYSKDSGLRIIETVSRTASFNGQSNLIQYINLIGVAENPFIALRKNTYYLAQEAPFIYATHGETTEILGSQPEKRTTVYQPYVNRRATLKVGESLTYAIRGEQSSDQSPEKQSISDTYTYTYLGDESVSIGDRKVNACKFKISVGKNEYREWIYKSLPILSTGADEKTINEKTIKLTLNGKDY